MPPVTVLLRILNPGEDLLPLLASLRAQTLAPQELLVVDSGSTDGSPERAHAAGARIVIMPAGTFSHARSTNLGFREARGEIVAMLSQDALPVGPRWLETLVAPLADPRVAATFGRQVPRPGCFPLERWEVERCYPAAGDPGVVYSNVNSAARRAAWEDGPFDEQVDSTEDRLWALAQTARGRRVLYVPDAAVIHSHTYTLGEVFARCRAEAEARRRGEGAGGGWGLLLLAWPRTVVADARRLAAEGAWTLWPRAAAYRFAQYAGLLRGGRG